jgi:GNAT superfamily N-acetyltransferase
MEVKRMASVHADGAPACARLCDIFRNSPVFFAVGLQTFDMDLMATSAELLNDNTQMNSDKPRVEMATLEDLPALTELVMDLFSMSAGDFKPDKDAQERGLSLILEQPNRGRIAVVRNNDQIFGMVNMLFTISTARGGFVILMEDVVIHPHHRGQGYGTMLVDHVIEYAKQKGFLRITLLTDRISAESQDFFKKQGFEYSNMIPMRRLIEGT